MFSLDYRVIEIKTDISRKPEGENQQRKDWAGCVSYEELARRKQTAKRKQAKKKPGLDRKGIVRCSSFLLRVGEVKETFESWSRNQKCQQIESEQSWDRLEGESINTDGGPCRILGPSLG